MPLYKIVTPRGLLSSDAKANLAAEISQFHSSMSGLAEAYAKILFESFAPEDGFIGREPGPAVILTVKVREGRPGDYRHKLLNGLKDRLQRATGAADRVSRSAPELPLRQFYRSRAPPRASRVSLCR